MFYNIITYGCQMNEYDSERLSSTIESLGYEKSDTYENAELVVINTCTIREKASEKMYSEIGRINLVKKEMQKNGKYMIIAITGCVPELEKEKIFTRANYVDISIGPQSYHKLKDMILEIKKTLYVDEKSNLTKPKKTHLMDLEFNTTEKFDFLDEERKGFDGVSSYITIQEGCDKFCTYCVVPNTRGKEVSRNPEMVLREVEKVVSMGAREIVFLGQNVNAYHGVDQWGKTWSLGELIRKTAENENVFRIRYTTSHPRDVSDDLIDAHKNVKKLMPYLHLPVQSGSDAILKKMNRKYTAESYFDVIKKFREAVPDIVFSSDFIVGFPNETDEDAEATIELVKRVVYQSQCFSFKYSKRPGTVANLAKDVISDDTKSQRLYRLQKLLDEQRLSFNNSWIGKELEVLFDRKDLSNSLQIGGRSQFMQTVIANCKDEQEKQSYYSKIKKVRIEKVTHLAMIGVVVN
ncbi:MAG: hypothetical protein RL208_277 [Pseudomonadota bacterium]|jgi:tRNA-2-methylthio-N6-dimethylallyladenosine synthase